MPSPAKRISRSLFPRSRSKSGVNRVPSSEHAHGECDPQEEERSRRETEDLAMMAMAETEKQEIRAQALLSAEEKQAVQLAAEEAECAKLHDDGMQANAAGDPGNY